MEMFINPKKKKVYEAGEQIVTRCVKVFNLDFITSNFAYIRRKDFINTFLNKTVSLEENSQIS